MGVPVIVPRGVVSLIVLEGEVPESVDRPSIECTLAAGVRCRKDATAAELAP